jgi:hypothetical protein
MEEFKSDLSTEELKEMQDNAKAMIAFVAGTLLVSANGIALEHAHDAQDSQNEAYAVAIGNKSFVADNETFDYITHGAGFVAGLALCTAAITRFIHKRNR